MKSISYKSCFGCLTGAALAFAAGQPVAAGEAQPSPTPRIADARSNPSPIITASDAWVLLAPPGVKTHAAYLVLTNHSREARAITGVASPQYKSAALHVSQTKDGVAMMQHLAQVGLPAVSSVAFKPHGLHVMLMGPKGPQALGDKVTLTFTLDDGSTLDVTAEVRKRVPGGSMMNHDHMDHGAMGHKGS